MGEDLRAKRLAMFKFLLEPGKNVDESILDILDDFGLNTRQRASIASGLSGLNVDYVFEHMSREKEIDFLEERILELEGQVDSLEAQQY